MANLETSYMGLHLKNPIIVASSGLTNSVEKIKGLEEAGAGAVVLKSIFEEQINNEVSYLIHKDPQNLYPEAEDYIRNYTRENSVEQHLNLLKDAKKECSIPIIASINCVSSQEWTRIAKDFENAGADALELNLFIIPTSRQEKTDEIEQIYIDVLSKVKKQVKIPVSVKIGFYFTNLIAMSEKLMANGASAVTMFNRFYEPDINIEKLEITASEVFSSPSDIRRSLRWIGMISAALPKLEIAASTGIHDGEAVIKQLLAGAQVAQVCSVVYINGAQVIDGMLKDLTSFMKKWNFKTIGDFRGRLSYTKVGDPMLYERAQFMKYFSGRS
ncbi:dihydroorotate dehydrogenase-like protein [Sunxiuqinia sp. A32]|uniref:dihydroorotate dehydrogenase-like protein n=1 Tax=Sunxiuqinia sp. A32 TaxID=3461496 RepID=UPI004045C258